MHSALRQRSACAVRCTRQAGEIRAGESPTKRAVASGRALRQAPCAWKSQTKRHAYLRPRHSHPTPRPHPPGRPSVLAGARQERSDASAHDAAETGHAHSRQLASAASVRAPALPFLRGSEGTASARPPPRTRAKPQMPCAARASRGVGRRPSHPRRFRFPLPLCDPRPCRRVVLTRISRLLLVSPSCFFLFPPNDLWSRE